MVSKPVHSLLYFCQPTLLYCPNDLLSLRKVLAPWRMKTTTTTRKLSQKLTTLVNIHKDWILINPLFLLAHTTYIQERTQDRFLYHQLWMRLITTHGAEKLEELSCPRMNWNLGMIASKFPPESNPFMKLGKEPMLRFCLGLLGLILLK